MDNYIEQILKAKTTTMQQFKFVLSVALTVFGALILLMGPFSNSFGIGGAIIIIGAILIYVTKNGMNIEYEYEFTNGDCSIDKIINMSSRKKAYRFSVGDVQRILPYESDKFKNELQIDAKLSVLNLTSLEKEKSNNWYAFMIGNSSQTTAVILELDDRSLEHVRMYYKQKLEK